jgi:transcriptional regulator with XRE-family HTH domain
MTDSISFGTWLRRRRRELDLTQQAFADHVGCARITLSRIEADTLKPSKELALILVEKVGVPESQQESWVRFARGQGGMPSQQKAVSIPKSPTNLPAYLTSFIGREQEQADLVKLIGKHRLVTLTGSGGTGKTRLSLQVALEQISNFKEGVWLVELAPISDATFIVSTIAAVFNLREVQGVPLLNTVMDYLRAKELFLLLDNCEHLVEASAQIANQLLHSCPYLKIIASSREALGIDGETVYRVPSLKEGEATRLFAERAARTEPRFHITDENASFVAQICHRLDGIPLAIELAAARVKLFTPQQIAERLHDRFKLLTSDSRTALPRHQTLRALID